MKKILLLIMSLLILSQNVFGDQKSELKNHFLNKIDDVVLIVKDKNLNKSVRNNKIVETLTPMFDFRLMAKLSLGKSWKKIQKEDRTKFISLYVERMKQSYSSKIDSYSDEKIEVTNIIQKKKNKIELVSNLMSNESKLEISYKFYKPKKQKKNKDIWLVYDVVILGVSILKTDRAQFQEFLQTNSIDDLMIQLTKK